jgi:aminobenzoyl-glutamate transport protein
VIFVLLIVLVILASHIFYLLGATATYQTINPETDAVETVTANAQSLLTADGLRFMFTGVVQNFMNFNATTRIVYPGEEQPRIVRASRLARELRAG